MTQQEEAAAISSVKWVLVTFAILRTEPMCRERCMLVSDSGRMLAADRMRHLMMQP